MSTPSQPNQPKPEYLISQEAAVVQDVERLGQMHDIVTEPMLGQVLFDEVLRRHNEKPGELIKIADVGAGPSHSSRSLLAKVNEYNSKLPEDEQPINVAITGFDQPMTANIMNNPQDYAEMDTNGALRALPQYDNLTFVGHNVADPVNTLPGGPYDIITANNIINYIPEKALNKETQQLVEVYRPAVARWDDSLADKGEIIVVTNGAEMTTEYVEDDDMHRFMGMLAEASAKLGGSPSENPRVIKEILESLGLNVEETKRQAVMGGPTEDGQKLAASYVKALTNAKLGFIHLSKLIHGDNTPELAEAVGEYVRISTSCNQKIEERSLPEGKSTFYMYRAKKVNRAEERVLEEA